MLYAKGSNLDYDAGFEEKATMFGKPCIVDDRTATELVAEALKSLQPVRRNFAALGESAEMSGESSSRTNLEIYKHRKTYCKNY
jgi:beta-glucosidase